jgi:hypothetical protein
LFCLCCVNVMLCCVKGFGGVLERRKSEGEDQ